RTAPSRSPPRRSAAAGCARPAPTATRASPTTSSRPSSTSWASPPASCPTTTSAARSSSIRRWTWRPTPPRGWRGRTPSCSGAAQGARASPPGPTTVDALDFVEIFLADQPQTSLDELNDVYVLVTFRPPATKKNWPMDCGVAGYDNSFGLPPFFPTRLRFEDY